MSTETTEAAPKTKATKTKPAPKAAKKTEAKVETKKEKGGLNGSQIKVLKALKGGKELTRAELTEKTGIAKGWAKLLGAATKDGDWAENSMEGMGLVKSGEAQEGKRGLAYTITAKGTKALETAK